MCHIVENITTHFRYRTRAFFCQRYLPMLIMDFTYDAALPQKIKYTILYLSIFYSPSKIDIRHVIQDNTEIESFLERECLTAISSIVLKISYEYYSPLFCLLHPPLENGLNFLRAFRRNVQLFESKAKNRA